MQMKTTATSAKVGAATAGAGIGAAASTLIIWLLEAYAGVTMPPPVQAAATVIVSALCAWGLGYLKSPNLRDTIIAETEEQVKA